MEINEIMKLIQAVSDYGLTSFELEEGNVKISLKREKETQQIVSVTSSVSAEIPQAVQLQAAQLTAVPSLAAASPADGAMSSDKIVTSPLVGTFYISSTPESEAFVKVGDTVKKGQVMGIIEAMKLMNEIESEFDGVVEAVLVNNEDVVEYGQPLFRIH